MFYDDVYDMGVECTSCFPAHIIEDDVSVDAIIEGLSMEEMKNILLELSETRSVKSFIVDRYCKELTEKQKVHIINQYEYIPYNDYMDHDAAGNFYYQRKLDLKKELELMVSKERYETALDLSLRIPAVLQTSTSKYLSFPDDEVWGNASGIWPELGKHLTTSHVFERVYEILSDNRDLLTEKELKDNLIALLTRDDERERILSLVDEYLAARDGSVGIFPYDFIVLKLQLLDAMKGSEAEWKKLVEDNSDSFIVLKYLYSKYMEEGDWENAILYLKKMITVPSVKYESPEHMIRKLMDLLEKTGRKDELLEEKKKYILTFRQEDLELYHDLKKSLPKEDFDNLKKKIMEAEATRYIIPDIIADDGDMEKLFNILKEKDDMYLYKKFSKELLSYDKSQYLELCLKKIYFIAEITTVEYDAVASNMSFIREIDSAKANEMAVKLVNDFWRKRNLKKALQNKGFEV